jgi:fermentation-respiration switch protein FrsA (DUF1100 family)
VLATEDPGKPPTIPRRGRISGLFESATRPAGELPPFDPAPFASQPPLDVVVQTPNPSQLLAFGRPPTTRPTHTGASPRITRADLPASAKMLGAELWWIAFKGKDDEWVPALLAVPAGKTPPEGGFPLVVATHGLFSSKMQVFLQVGPSLIERGFAVLMIDLPLHGEREGWPVDIVDRTKPDRMVQLWQRSVVNVRQAIDLAGRLPFLSSTRDVTLVGYSLGSWMSVLAGACDDRVGSLVLFVGGANELSGELLAIRGIASADPRTAIARFAPRPLLLVSGRFDQTVTPAMATRLFAAANQPKEQRWYDQGHLLREPAFSEAAEWALQTHQNRPPPPTKP